MQPLTHNDSNELERFTRSLIRTRVWMNVAYYTGMFAIAAAILFATLALIW